MAKSQKNTIETFGLSATIRRRIDELIDLSLSPTTINLFTSEFAKIDDSTHENISRYIAALLEIQNDQLEAHIIANKANKTTGLTQQEIILKQRQANLVRIQNAFNRGKNFENHKSRKEMLSNLQKTSNASINVRNLMVTKSEKDLSLEEQEREKLRELANKKRLIELAILEQEQKIKVAEKQYNFAKSQNDEATQEIKLGAIKASTNKINEIKSTVKRYGNIADFPLEILMDEDQTIDATRDEKKLRDFLAKKQKDSMKKLQNDVDLLQQYDDDEDEDDINDYSTSASTTYDFFKVDGYDECEVHDHMILNEDEHRQIHDDDSFTQPISEPNNKVTKVVEEVSLSQELWGDDMGVTIENPFDEIIDDNYISKNLGTDDDSEPSVLDEKPIQKQKESKATLSATNDEDPWALTSEIWSASDEQIIVKHEEEIAELNDKKSELTVYFEKLEQAKKIAKDNKDISQKFDKLLDEKIKEQADKVAELSLIEEKQKIMNDYLEKLKKAKKIAKQNELEINNLWAKKEKEWLDREEEKLNLISPETEEVTDEKNDKDLIIKKIKKNSKAKDKKIERIKRERDLFEKELIELKLQQKVEELRKIEMHKLKALENIENVEKHEKIKGSSSLDLLKEKVLGHIATTSLKSKGKANDALEVLKSRATSNETIEVEDEDDFLGDLELIADAEISSTIQEFEKSTFTDDATQTEFAKNNDFDNEKTVEFDSESSRKRLEFLERKNKLNIINSSEKQELEQLLTRNKNQKKQFDLKKYSLVVKRK